MRAEGSDEQLAAAWQAGDDAAGARLLRRYVQPLDRYFHTKVGRDDAEDLRQDTLIQITRSIERFRFDSSFRTYLYRIAYRTLCDRLRYRESGRGRRDAAQCSLEQLHGAALLDPTLDDELCDLVAAMRMLSADDQVLIELRYIEGLSYAELAAVTGASCAMATLRARVHGIKLRLRALLGEQDERERGLESPDLVAEPEIGARLRRLRQALDGLASDGRAYQSWAWS